MFTLIDMKIMETSSESEFISKGKFLYKDENFYQPYIIMFNLRSCFAWQPFQL